MGPERKQLRLESIEGQYSYPQVNIDFIWKSRDKRKTKLFLRLIKKDAKAISKKSIHPLGDSGSGRTCSTSESAWAGLLCHKQLDRSFLPPVSGSHPAPHTG